MLQDCNIYFLTSFQQKTSYDVRCQVLRNYERTFETEDASLHLLRSRQGFLKVLWDLDGTHIMARPRGARRDERSIIFHLHLPSSIRRLTPRRQAPSEPHPRPPTASMSLLSHFIRVAAAPSF